MLEQQKFVATTTEIRNRIGQVTAVFVSLKWCLWNKTNITTKTKGRLFWTNDIASSPVWVTNLDSAQSRDEQD